MNTELDELYLRWLYSQIRPISVKNPARTNWSFAKQLFEKEFIWLIPNDDNRLADGRDLRDEFFMDYSVDVNTVPEDWLDLGCSMLEMLVALSRRLAFMSGGEPRDSFWIFVENLEIGACYDTDYRKDRDLVHKIDAILDRVIWRTYDYDGAGGLFPLMHPPRDQTKTELWYQMSAYVLEQEGV